MRWGDWKDVVKPLGSQSVELYNLKTDRGEERDVASRHPDVVEKILAIAAQAHELSPLWNVRPPRAKRQN